MRTLTETAPALALGGDTHSRVVAFELGADKRGTKVAPNKQPEGAEGAEEAHPDTRTRVPPSVEPVEGKTSGDWAEEELAHS